MADSKINILIEAQNRASAELKNVQKDVEAVGTSTGKLAEYMAQTEAQFASMRQSLDAFGGSAKTADESVAKLGSSINATTVLTTGFLTVLSAAAGIFGSFIEQMQKAEAVTASINFASQAGDAGKLRSEMADAAKALELWNVQADAGRKAWGELFSGNIMAGVSGLVSQFRAWTTDTALLHENIRKARQELEQLIGFESQRTVNTLRVKELEAQEQGVKVTAGVATRDLDVQGFEAAIERQRRMNTQQATLQIQNINLAAAEERTEALSRYAGPEELAAISAKQRAATAVVSAKLFSDDQALLAQLEQGRQAITGRINAGWVKMAEETFAETRAGQMAEVALTDAARKAEDALTAEGIKGWVAMAEGTFAETTANQLRENADRDRRYKAGLEGERGVIALQLRDAARLSQIPGLSRSEREDIAFYQSATREQLTARDLELRARLTTDDNTRALLQREAGLVAQEEGMVRAGVAKQRAERLDPVAGLQSGLRQAAEEMSEQGSAMQRLALDTASNMQRAFADNFFAVITGDFKKLPEIATEFGRAMVRSFVNELATLATGQVFSMLRGAFGGAGGLMGFSAAPMVAGAMGAPGAGGAMALAGFSGGGGGGGGEDAISAAMGIAGGGGGGGSLGGIVEGIRSFLGTPLFSSANAIGGFGRGAAMTSQDAIDAAMAGGGLYEGSGAFDVSGFFSGTSYGSALGAAGAAVALGFQAYSGFTDEYQNPTTASVLGGTATGALSGAMIGSAIFPGIGTAVGAIGGALLGFASSSKEGGKGITDRRNAQRLKDGSDTLRKLSSAIDAATDREEAAMSSIDTGNSVGGVLMAIAEANVQGGFSNGFNWPPSSTAAKVRTYLASLGLRPERIKIRGIDNVYELVANFAPAAGSKRPRTDRVAGAQAAQTLLERFWGKRNKAFIEYSEDLGEITRDLQGSARNLTRTTVLNAERLHEAQGQDISFLRDSFSGTDEQMKRLLERLAKVDRDYDVGILRTEKDFGAQVSIGHATV